MFNWLDYYNNLKRLHGEHVAGLCFDLLFGFWCNCGNEFYQRLDADRVRMFHKI